MSSVVIVSASDWESVHSRLNTLQKYAADLSDFVNQIAAVANIPDLTNQVKAVDSGYGAIVESRG